MAVSAGGWQAGAVSVGILSGGQGTLTFSGGVTTMTCAASADQAHGGARSLRLDFNIVANGWATCAHFFDSPQDWSGGQGLSFYLRSASAGPVIHVDLYAGPSDNRETYYYALELPPDSVNTWIPKPHTVFPFPHRGWQFGSMPG